MDKYLKLYPLYLIFCGLAFSGLRAEPSSPINSVHPAQGSIVIDFLGKGGLTGIYFESILWENRLWSKVGLGAGFGLYPSMYLPRNLVHPALVVGGTRSGPSLNRTIDVLAVVPIYLHIQPLVKVLQPLSERVRFYLEPGTYLSPFENRLAFMVMGIQINKKSEGDWGRLGVVIFISPDQDKGNLWPNLALGLSF